MQQDNCLESFRLSRAGLSAIFGDNIDVLQRQELPSAAFNWHCDGIDRTAVLDPADLGHAEELGRWLRGCQRLGIHTTMLVTHGEAETTRSLLTSLNLPNPRLIEVDGLDVEDFDNWDGDALTLRERILFPDEAVVTAYENLRVSWGHDVWHLCLSRPFWAEYGQQVTRWLSRLPQFPREQALWNECYPYSALDVVREELPNPPVEFTLTGVLDSATGKLTAQGKEVSFDFGRVGDGTWTIQQAVNLPFIFDATSPDGTVRNFGRFPGCSLSLQPSLGPSFLAELKARFIATFLLPPKLDGVTEFSGTTEFSQNMHADCLVLRPVLADRQDDSASNASGQLTINLPAHVKVDIDGLSSGLVGQRCKVCLPGLRTPDNQPLTAETIVADNFLGGGLLHVTFVCGDYRVEPGIDAVQLLRVELRMSAEHSGIVSFLPVAPE
jgi:hypothetical protein